MLKKQVTIVFLFTVLAIWSFGQSGNSLVFIKNQGQWESHIKHRVAVPNGMIFLESDAFTHTRYSGEDFETHHEAKHEDESTADDVILHGHNWKTQFLGSNSQTSVSGKNKRSEYYNFFLGNDPSKWAGNVSAFNTIYYTDFYNGIDMEVYSQDGSFKYDLIVAPGVSPNQISWKYDGLDNYSLVDGNLKLETSVGDFFEMNPYAYQVVSGFKIKVECQFILNNDVVSFHFPNGYDASKELIIDPVLVGATLSGTTGTNYGHCATYDDAGNIYTGAIAFGMGYPATVGAFQTTSGGGAMDIALSCLSPDASTLLYATYLGGGGTDYPHSMIVSPSGELHVFGTSSSADFPTSPGALNSSLNGQDDIVVTHFNASGSGIIGSTYIGGVSDDGRNNLSGNYGDSYRGEIILDAAGNICIASCTESSNFPVTAGAYQTAYGGGAQDAVLFSLNPTCSTLNWSTFVGGAGHEVGFGLRIDGAHVFMCGGTDGQFFTSSGVQAVYGGGGTDGFVLRFDNNCSTMTASTYWGYGSEDYTFFIDTDLDGGVYIYGQSDGASTPITPGVYANPNSNQFIAKMDETLSTLDFSTQLGLGNGTGIDFIPIAFMVDNCKQIYFSGHSAYTGLTTSTGALQTSGGFYLGVLEPGAIGLVYATYYGGYGDHVDGGTSRFDPQGVVYQAACTISGFSTSPGAWSSTYPVSYDVGVFKIDFEAQSNSAVAGAAPSTTGCAPFTVNFLNTGSGNQFIWDFDDNGASSTQFEPTYTFNTPGTYNVMLIAIDSSACTTTDTNYLTITVASPISVDLGNDTTICSGNVLLDAGISGATTTYTWQDNSSNQTYDVTTTGTYWVEVSDSGCVASDTINITIGNPVVDLGPDLQTCTPTMTLDAMNPGATYLWQDNSTNQTFDVTAIGTYWVEVDVGGCTASDTIEITAGSITTSLPNDTLMCDGEILTLDAGNPGATYLWQDNSSNQTFDVTQSGTYFVDVTLGICTATDTIDVEYFSPEPFFTVQDTTGCTDFFTSFTDLSTTSESTITSWFWEFGDSFTSSDQNPLHQYGSSGNYSVSLTVTTANGCQATFTRNVQITIYPKPLAGFSFTPLFPEVGDELNFVDESTNATSWLWDFNGEETSSQQYPAYTFTGNGTFVVTLHVESAYGCTDSIAMYIDIREDLIFYVPNAFTPDGDEFNNVWQPIFTSGFDASDYHLMIFNRWGEVVFESYNHEVGWDGTYGGKLVADNVFTWVIEFGDINNDERHTVNGHLTILR